LIWQEDREEMERKEIFFEGYRQNMGFRLWFCWHSS